MVRTPVSCFSWWKKPPSGIDVNRSLPDLISKNDKRRERWWRIVLLCGSPRLQTHSCGSRPAWRDRQTASAPSCIGWAELKTAADFSRDGGTKHLFLPDGKEILQQAGSHNKPSWSEETNVERKHWVAPDGVLKHRSVGCSESWYFVELFFTYF